MDTPQLDKRDKKFFRHLVLYYFDDIEQCIFHPTDFLMEFPCSPRIIKKMLEHLRDAGLISLSDHRHGDNSPYWRIRFTEAGIREAEAILP
jgi:hypothetical protein